MKRLSEIKVQENKEVGEIELYLRFEDRFQMVAIEKNATSKMVVDKLLCLTRNIQNDAYLKTN